MTNILSYDETLDYLLKHNASSEIVGFLTFNKNNINQFTPKKWVEIGELINDHPTISLNELIPIIGEIIAVQLLTYYSICNELPNAYDILEGKITDLPKTTFSNPSSMYSILWSLSFSLNEMKNKDLFTKAVNNFIDIVLTFPTEFAVYALRVATDIYGIDLKSKEHKKLLSFYKKCL